MSSKQGSMHEFDPETGIVVVNETSVSNDNVMEALGKQRPELVSIANWYRKTQSSPRDGGIFQRDRYVTPASMFDQFKTAQDAAHSDDVVSGVVEATEALAFNRVSIDCEDPDEENVWNQIVDDIDLDGRLREIWRELFIVSNCYVGTVYGRKSYKVGGKSRTGKKRKKSFNDLVVPIGMTVLDPLKIVPVGNFMFGQEKLAYIADKTEMEHFDDVLAGSNTTDLPVRQLIKSKYQPYEGEKKALQELTSNRNLDNLYILDPDRTTRFTATRPGYARFAPCRMKSVFELLDLKQQLRQMDRAHLLGATSFIVLVTIGDKDSRPDQSDINALKSQVQVSARVPVIVGDYTLDVKIITPKTDHTLRAERYNTLDSRLTARLYQIASSGGYQAGFSGDDSVKLTKVIARGLESRRYMIKRDLEKTVFKQTYEKNDQFTSEPEINFHPRTISLNFDHNFANFMFDMYQNGDISRETFLSEFDLSQEEEARKLTLEEEAYGDVFDNDDDGLDQKGAGRRKGGFNNGGGDTRDSYRSQPGRGPDSESPRGGAPVDESARQGLDALNERLEALEQALQSD